MAVDLPRWPPGTVATLVTGGARPHAIPVSALVRADASRILLGLAPRRESLERLRQNPEVTLSIIGPDLAVSVGGHARVATENLTARMVGVEITADELQDHLQPTFRVESGVRWHWTSAEAAEADAEVHAALRRLAGAE